VNNQKNGGYKPHNGGLGSPMGINRSRGHFERF
jgi:hypothetical protein